MKKRFIGLGIILAVIAITVVNQFIVLRKAHSTFDNYYAFRGCSQLIKKANTYGVCKLPSGKTIKIVEHKGRWYLDGDLPTCVANFCF